MNYPVWDVPHIGSGLVIAIIAIFHIMISHFAIGGGFYLPIAERMALKKGREDWLDALKGHAKFFLILTAAFGTVSGVGIWFAIGLASPEGTSTLIHNFVFGWAMEWCCFIVEVTAAAVYYYTWGRVSDRLHLQIGIVYAVSAWLSLVIINGILTFMLTPGNAWLAVAGSGEESSTFWQAFLNPGYFPSAILRTLICCSLAGIWALVTASRIDGERNPGLKTDAVRFSVLWLVPSFILLPIVFAWYLLTVPAQQLGLLELGMATIGQGTFTNVTRMGLVTVLTSAAIAAFAYLLAWRTPTQFKFGQALALLFLALVATASTEYAREMLRKPYVVGDHMYSNGVRVADVERLNREGYLSQSPWLREGEQGDDDAAQLAKGEIMFRGQCMACHTRYGYRSMKRLMAGRDKEGITSFLNMLHDYEEDTPYRKYMPPLVGTQEEVDAMVVYMDTLLNAPVPLVAADAK